MKQIHNILYYLVLSVIAVVLLIILIVTTPSQTVTIGLPEKFFVAVVFITSCIFGISLALFPGWLRKSFRLNDQHVHAQSKKTERHYKGHHPDCDAFQSHTITIKNRVLCAGCLGLIIGSLISIVAIVIIIFFIDSFQISLLYGFFILGFLILAVVYSEIVVSVRYAIVHVISNSMLVVSFLFFTLGVFHITGNTVYGVMVILFSFLWLDTRIQLSNYSHKRICQLCTENCKMY